MAYVVGALGSRPVPSKGMGRGASTEGRREPRGKRHAVDAVTGQPACGTFESLRIFDELAWGADGDWCTSCEAVVPFAES